MLRTRCSYVQWGCGAWCVVTDAVCSPHWQISVPGTAAQISLPWPRASYDSCDTVGQLSQPAGSHRRGGLKNPKCKPPITLTVTSLMLYSELRPPAQWPEIWQHTASLISDIYFSDGPGGRLKHNNTCCHPDRKWWSALTWWVQLLVSSLLQESGELFAPLGLRHAKLVNGLCWGKLFTCFQRFNWDKFINCLIPKMLGSISLPVWINC